ncbi:MAG: baseplate protein J [Symploca sp. SIO1B1]|nr:baseplate protein J [Symploca sp. SIO1B1]
MPLPLPNLDDRNYNELVEEALALIPQEYPEWTDHNPSDTGIILIELLAWLTEQILYSVDQISDRNRLAFLSLLQGKQLPENQNIDELIKKTLLEIRKPYRSITPEDFESLALNWQEEAQWVPVPVKSGYQAAGEFRELSQSLATNAKKQGDKGKVGRALCLGEQSGALRLIIVPKDWEIIPDEPTLPEELKKNLTDFFDLRKLLTTKLDIVAPGLVPVTLSATLYLEDGSKPEVVKELVQKQLTSFFAPLNSGDYWQGKGWPFGRSVYLSEVYQLLDNLRGVDYVEDLEINENANKEIPLQANQLVKADIEGSEFTVMVRKGNDWREATTSQ